MTMAGIRQYIVQQLGQDERSKGRSAAADYIRLAALIGLIVTHTLSMELDVNQAIQGKHYVVLQILSMMGNLCNVLYIMLSGAFLYRYKEESPIQFYKKRFSEVVLPLFVYYVVYLYKNQMLTAGTKMSDLIGYVNAFLRGEVSIAPHYWLIYQILCIYVTVPFFRRFFKDYRYRWLTELCVVCLFFMIGNRVLMWFNAYTILNIMFPEWLMISFLGYWIMQKESRRYDGWIMFVGILATILMIYLYFQQKDLGYYIQNQSPVKVLMGLGLMSCCLHFPVFAKQNPVIRLVAKYNFGMTLIHWAALTTIRVKWGYSIVYGAYVFGILRGVGLNLLLSLGMALLIDNFIVQPIRCIPKYIMTKCGLNKGTE